MMIINPDYIARRENARIIKIVFEIKINFYGNIELTKIIMSSVMKYFFNNNLFFLLTLCNV